VFYLDLKKEIPDDADMSPVTAVHRLARPGTLLILDNIHHQPELAHQLWQQWNAKPSDSRGRLLLVATRIHQSVVATPEQDLMFFQKHPANPAILIQPTPADLGRLAKHLYRRVGGAKCPPMPEPPAEVLAEWHPVYRAALNAFAFAVLDSLAEFQKGRWALPPSRASAWVRKHWLEKLDAPELENSICLAAFGAEALEMSIREEALPYPGKTEKLETLGLLIKYPLGKFGQFHDCGLREPGWGRLILEAIEPARNHEQILFDTAARHPAVAVTLDQRLKLEGFLEIRNRLWTVLEEERESMAAKLFDVPLQSIEDLLRESEANDRTTLASYLWQTIESHPKEFAETAWVTALDQVAHFMEVAKCSRRPLWVAIIGEVDKHDQQTKLERLAKQAWEMSLAKVASFLKVAKQQGCDTAPLWRILESNHDRLTAQLWETSLEHAAFYLEVAQAQGRETNSLWRAFEQRPIELSGWGKSSATSQLARFFHSAPDSVVKAMLSAIELAHWDTIPVSTPMIAGIQVAARCGEVGRDDHKSKLIATVISRANPDDFPSGGWGLSSVAWLLSNASPNDSAAASRFLDQLCTNKWLGVQFTHSSCGSLANGLRLLAMDQTPHICQRFHGVGLGIRLKNELSTFSVATPEQQGEIMQFLGCANLCGWVVRHDWLRSVPLDRICALPENTLAHQPDAIKVEDWQLQLWLGLRTYVSISHARLVVPRGKIEETLRLWRVNLQETASMPNSVIRRLNQSMVAWLESCLRTNPVSLIPSREPLWTLAGFPLHLSFPKTTNRPAFNNIRL
jgi:hypothetical protein